MDAGEVVQREQVRAVLTRYTVLADSGRFEELAALFTEDGVLDVDGVAHAGRAAVVALLRAASGGPRLVHHVSAPDVDVTGATATARSAFLVLGPHGVDHWGRYRDDLARVGGAWQFVRRRVRLDGRAPGARGHEDAP